jgi:uroporphyrinogen-III synthase
MDEEKKRPGFAGRRVLTLESRRAVEMAKLISNYGGEPIVAPSMREVPLESNMEALAFANTLFARGFDLVIFLTGVGTRALTQVVETVYSREQFVEALKKVQVIVRGPKPLAALKELGVTVALAVPEPNTWRDLLRSLDEMSNSLLLAGRRVAVQEYGVSNPELLHGLEDHGAQVTRVPVYRWALPEDTGPLRKAVRYLAEGQIDVLLFTTSVQAVHLMQMAAEMKLIDAVRIRAALMAIGSIGPVTSEELREQGLPPDFEPSHPKMGFLVKEAAEQCAAILRQKRS